jgi:heme exporter protein C
MIIMNKNMKEKYTYTKLVKYKIIYTFYHMLKSKNMMYFLKYIHIPVIFLGISFFISGIYLGLYVNINDFQQGEAYKIIYIHVPSAWMSITLYTLLTIFSIIYIFTKLNTIYELAYIIAIVGLHFTLITLITGAFWGKLSWGSYLAWDARLISVFFLFILYFIYVVIASLPEQLNFNYKRFSSIIAIIGFINIPVIKYSVDWWNTLHQSSSVTSNYLSIDYSIFVPLILIYIGLLFFTISIISLHLRKIYLIFTKKNYF